MGEASSFALMDFERDDGFVLACTATLKSDVTIEADVEEDPDARRIAVGDFEGEVVRLDDLAHDVKGVRIALDGDGIDFQAGQYVMVKLPGVEGTRAFSIANAPSDPRHVELQVRRVPGGAGTGYVHEKLKLGERVRFSGPYGRFVVRKSRGGPLIFLAGGTGVSSPRAMILDLLEEGYARADHPRSRRAHARPISTAARNSRRWPASTRISAMSRRCPASRRAAAWAGRARLRARRRQAALRRRVRGQSPPIYAGRRR